MGEALTSIVHHGLVSEALSKKFMTDREFRIQMSSHYARLSDEVEAAIAKKSRYLGWAEHYLDFQLEKWRSLLTPELETRYMEIDGGSVRTATALQYQLAINIIEASDTDRISGVFDNTNYGIALAASSIDMMPWVDNHKDLVWPYSKGWYDGYIAWNMNFVAGVGSLKVFPNLFIPSVMCTAKHDVRALWVQSRLMSLKSNMAEDALMFKEPLGQHRTATSKMTMSKKARREVAKVCVRHTDIPPPCQGLDDQMSNDCYGHGSLYRLWNYLKPYDTSMLGGTSTLSDKWFALYFTVVAWAIVAAFGLGSEITLGHTLMTWIATHQSGTVIWHLAQLSFSLMLAVAFTATGGYGMPFLAVGLWKFGFPETVNCLIMFKIQDSKFSLRAISFLIDGYGTLLHHLSTSFTLVALMLHLFPHDRALTAACIVPIMQHMFILLKYHARTAYLILELTLEAWFQWEVISNVSSFHADMGLEITRVGRGMAMTMVFAHWLYLIGSALHMLDDIVNKHDKLHDLDEANICRTIEKQSTMKQFMRASQTIAGKSKTDMADLVLESRDNL